MERLHNPRTNDRLLAATTQDGWEIWVPDHNSGWYDLFRQLDNTPVQLINDSARVGCISVISPCVATNWLFDCRIDHHDRIAGLCYTRLSRHVFEISGVCLPRFEEWQAYLNRESRLNPFPTQLQGQ